MTPGELLMDRGSTHDDLVAAARKARLHGTRLGHPGGIALWAGYRGHKEGVALDDNPFDGAGEEDLAEKWRFAWLNADEASRRRRETTYAHHTHEEDD